MSKHTNETYPEQSVECKVVIYNCSPYNLHQAGKKRVLEVGKQTQVKKCLTTFVVRSELATMDPQREEKRMNGNKNNYEEHDSLLRQLSW